MSPMPEKIAIINAVPLLLKPLSQQIKEAGGEGYNSSVCVQAVSNSFSHLYVFETSDGKKAIKTQNVFYVGMISSAKKHFVQFNGDTEEYTLVTQQERPKNESKLLFIKSLGHSFAEMQLALEAIWPERLVWDLTNPITNQG